MTPLAGKIIVRIMMFSCWAAFASLAIETPGPMRWLLGISAMIFAVLAVASLDKEW